MGISEAQLIAEAEAELELEREQMGSVMASEPLVSRDIAGNPIHLLGPGGDVGGGEIRNTRLSLQFPMLTDFFRGTAQTVGGAAGSGGGVGGVVAGGALGEMVADSVIQSVDNTYNLVRGREPYGFENPIATENFVEGGVGALVDKVGAPIFAGAKKAFSDVGEMAKNYGTDIGATRFQRIKPNPSVAEAIDPGGDKLVQSLQPIMSKFDDADKVGVKNRLFELQNDLGYLNDVRSPQELAGKMRRDIGYRTTKDVVLPDGSTIKQDVQVEGELGKRVGDAISKLAEAEAATMLPALATEAVQQDIMRGLAEGAVQYARRTEGVISPEQVKEAFMAKLPELTRALGPNPSIKTIHAIRRNFDAFVDKAFQKDFRDTTIDDDINKTIANTLRNIEDVRAQAIDPDLYSSLRREKRAFQVVKDAYDTIYKAEARAVKAYGGGNSVKVPSLSRSSMVGAAMNWLAPPETAESLFAQSQIASKFRGNDVTSDFSIGESGRIRDRVTNALYGAPGAVGQGLAAVGGFVTSVAEPLARPIFAAEIGSSVYEGIQAAPQTQFAGVPSALQTPFMPPEQNKRMALPRAVSALDQNIVLPLFDQFAAPQDAMPLKIHAAKIYASGDKKELARFMGAVAERYPDFPLQRGAITGLPSEFTLDDGKARLFSDIDVMRWTEEIEQSSLREDEKAQRLRALFTDGTVFPLTTALNAELNRKEEAPESAALRNVMRNYTFAPREQTPWGSRKVED